MGPLRHNRDYARLFGAQVVALTGTGLMTVALGLLAFEIAGEGAGGVLGTVFAIKMIAYVGLSPIAQALVARAPRKTVLIAADLVRAAAALCLPFVSELWQVFALVFVLQAASATFTPAYQSVLPDLLPDEGEYTRALSLSRLAYDMENLTSPALAGLALLLVPFESLFAGTALGFLASACLVALARVPRARAVEGSFRRRVTAGISRYLLTPRLRGLLSLNFCVAMVGAFVLVNTVVLVRGVYGSSESGLALAMAVFGAGSMASALALPALLERVADRTVMLRAGAGLAGLGLVAGLLLALQGPPPVLAGLAALMLAGALQSAVMTPSGRLIRRSGQAGTHAALFAAQFALSHACWLLSYPLAGWAGQALGFGWALCVMSGLGAAGVLMAAWVWPKEIATDAQRATG
ncbi:MFS transporter [Cognatishimia sp. F0-27]|uniref:MFS transporter n=1 Tax=Cognatishimia sp. F0-27 TaxID=2816855 RepID=UPI001D0C3B29|nr:MFS transporter [Cognatishimia sp. F0-27]MCC1493773.1 MFS transporter [Cognatishimia sp. F0-27]